MPDMSLEAIISRRRSLREFREDRVSLELLLRLLWSAQGITGAEGQRAAPSAHALYPLRLLVSAGNIEGLEPSLHAYHSEEDALRLRTQGDLRDALQEAALEEQPWLSQAAAVITICADFATANRAFAEQPPTGTRGNRYVYIEAGAAAQNLQLMATAEGLGCVLIAGFEDEATAAALKLPAPLAPVLHLCIGWPVKA